MSSLIESLRRIAVSKLFRVNAFSSGWNSSWQAMIQQSIGSQPTANSLLNLGDNLSNVFLSTRASASRNSTNTQSGLSNAGTAWESLMCWYLNLCMIGTRVVAFRSRSMIPSAFQDALSINYGTTVTNSESDLVVLVFPDHQDFTNSLTPTTTFLVNGQQKNPYYQQRLIDQRCLDIFDALSDTHFTDFSLSVIQCKTNWNDTAQVPMLWDLVYNTRTFMAGSQVTVGINNHQLPNLRRFTYCFATVPTNNLSQYDPTKMAVKRVANLSGGNYWGFPTRNGVAFSVKEIFNRNFSTGFTNLRTTLTNNIPALSTTYSYFNL